MRTVRLQRVKRQREESDARAFNFALFPSSRSWYEGALVFSFHNQLPKCILTIQRLLLLQTKHLQYYKRRKGVFSRPLFENGTLRTTHLSPTRQKLVPRQRPPIPHNSNTQRILKTYRQPDLSSIPPSKTNPRETPLELPRLLTSNPPTFPLRLTHILTVTSHRQQNLFASIPAYVCTEATRPAPYVALTPVAFRVRVCAREKFGGGDVLQGVVNCYAGWVYVWAGGRVSGTGAGVGGGVGVRKSCDVRYAGVLVC